jgi:putative SOS response-associated peptidase YedK
MINARSETVAEKPAFRAAFRKRRCLVLADGFYEWQKQNGTKQPYYVRLREGRPFAFAGLWEYWRGEKDEPVVSCTLLTTEPNSLVRTVHNRMPVILQPDDYDLWLDRDMQEPAALQRCLAAFGAGEMELYPVSRLVNSPKNDDPLCIEPLELESGPPLPGLLG